MFNQCKSVQIRPYYHNLFIRQQNHFIVRTKDCFCSQNRNIPHHSSKCNKETEKYNKIKAKQILKKTQHFHDGKIISC